MNSTHNEVEIFLTLIAYLFESLIKAAFDFAQPHCYSAELPANYSTYYYQAWLHTRHQFLYQSHTGHLSYVWTASLFNVLWGSKSFPVFVLKMTSLAVYMPWSLGLSFTSIPTKLHSFLFSFIFDFSSVFGSC
jgi:hypothetical protein